MPTIPKPFREFRGLNNVDDPIRLSLAWQTQADNVDITSRGSLARCNGFVRSTTNTAIVGSYATVDLQRLYIIDNGALKQVNLDWTMQTLKSGLSSTPYHFEEINGVVFYANGVDYGMIEPAGWRAWGTPTPAAPSVTMGSGSLQSGVYQVVCTFVDSRGMESGNSDVAVAEGSGRVIISSIPFATGYTTNVYVTQKNETVFYLLMENAPTSIAYDAGSTLGAELTYWNTSSPQGRFPVHFKGSIYLASWYPELDATHIFCSLPLQYHHFDFANHGIAVPGEVRMMKAIAEGVVIGTDRAIYLTDGEKLTQLAPYGVTYGWHGAMWNGDLYFWSLRGLCQAMPFQNLTEDKVSVAPGLSAGATVIEQDGYQRYLVALHTGGTAYNRR